MSIARGLVAWHRADGNINDTSGNGLNGTWAGSPSYVSGIYGQAYQFLGDNTTSVELGAETLSSRINGFPAITVSAWIKTTRIDKTWQSIANVFVRGAFAGLNFRINGQTIQMTGRSSAEDTIVAIQSENVISSDAWYHVAAINNYTSKTQSLFLNGERIEHETGIAFGSNVFVNSGSSNIEQIGNHPTAGRGFFGAIDNWMIYNRALTPSKIKTLYAIGSPI